ncbi:flagellar hook-length control protein [Marinobacter salinus]|uniref:Flagellar hook-length control protein n=1 Tax=Marinobacter salinus TaxID=1874317 RepID=A0A1D9GHT1_9GAMM|nr:flagellar hook-length control protein FliK [Marinobacter salinus]AOY87206.1 flagellar hook-length control protein [Marinobacter salinus]
MPQMVLPQTPAPGMQKDAGAGKTGASRETGDSESRYESVSRAEQKRLDRQKADRSNEDQAVENAQAPENNRKAQGSDESADAAPGASGKQDAAATGTGAGKAEQDTVSSELSGDMESITTPLTFAELQALLVPANGQSGTDAGGAPSGKAGAQSVIGQGVIAQVTPDAGPVSGVINGKPGLQGQVAPGVSSGLQLTDALTATLSADNSRASDPTSLATSARFQSAMDMASQQVANNTATKLSSEAALPLRGYATSIDVPVGHAEWGDKMVGKLSWLTARNMSVAEIHLTPPDMGPMEVKVRVHHDQANITVHAANPVVRDQLELNSHRLRDMLGEQGLSLAQFDVSDSPQQQGGEQAAGDGDGSNSRQNTGGLAGTDVDEGDLRSGNLDLSWKGEVDIFA